MTSIKKEMENRGVSVVLGSYNRNNFLRLTIETLRQELSQASFPSEIIVVDGGSSDGTLPWLLKQKDIITIVQHNRGISAGKYIKKRSWGYFMNLGFKAAQGKYICMLSDDCLVVPGAIRNGYDLFETERGNGRNLGGVAFYWRNWPNMEKYQVVTTLNDKLLVNQGMFLREALYKVDFIDEETYQFYNADGDLCIKMWNIGFEICASDTSFIEHFFHANINIRKSNIKSEKNDWDAFLRKWNGIFFDPDKANYGGSIYLSYSDPQKTAELYWKRYKIIPYCFALFDKLSGLLKKNNK
jgi:glycosyltransferase involved in cell wall biosynthesis